jgi:uncharacterized protein
MLKKVALWCFLLSLLSGAGGFWFFKNYSNKKSSLLLNTEYGEFIITEPVLIDLINDRFVQRLKKVRQYGPRYYVTKQEEYDRYEHSLGVFVLLRHYGASVHEQIAGLLHDASHTVFSHVGDFLFKAGDTYQDDIHEKFINETSLASVLQNYKIDVKDILHKNKLFTALEKDLPDLCADRLEYNLKGGLLEGLLNKEDIVSILDHLLFENGQWVFTTLSQAKKFAEVPLYLTQHVWGSPDGIVTYEWTSEALKRALAINLITLDDIHYSTDDLVWEKLVKSDDAELKPIMDKLINHKKHFIAVDNDSFDKVVKGKFRGINPFVKTERGIVRLTELDQEFSQEFNAVKQRMEDGWRIKFIS